VKRDLLPIASFLWVLILVVSSTAIGAVYEAASIPWSGYWWPFDQGGPVTGTDYRGHPAPLEKYDYVTSGIYQGPATIYGNSLYYDPDAPAWYGLCFAWAVASIMEEEPVHKGVYSGTVFRVGDKKALLTVLYDGVWYNAYHVRDPVEFQYVLETFIKGRNQPIVMDLGSEEEVWSFPVYKYEISSDEGDPIRHYTTTIHFASDMVHPDYTGTLLESRTYCYWFRLQGSEIIASGWEEASAGNPPKVAYEPLSIMPRNDGIDPDTVREIVRSTDDLYETNNAHGEAASLTSGRYDLLALDQDWFRVTLQEGDVLRVMPQWDEGAVISAQLRDPGQDVAEEMAADRWTGFSARENGDYYIKVVSSRPEEEYEYTLYIVHAMGYEALFPMYQPGGWANGVAMICGEFGTSAGRAVLCIMDEDGMPRKGIRIDEAAGHIGGILKEDFSLSSPEPGYLRVDSDSLMLGMGMQVSGQYLAFGADLMPLENAGSELFFPHFAGYYGIPDQWSTYFGLINTGMDQEELLLIAYDKDGYEVAEDELVLGPGEKWEKNTGLLAVLGGEAVCMSVRCMSGRRALAGYIRFSNPNRGRGQALIPLPLERSTYLTIPHVASGRGWGTALALMNCGDREAHVVLNAYDQEGSLVEAKAIFLKADQNLVDLVSRIFPWHAASIKSLEIISSGEVPLCGFSLYATSDGNCLAGQPIASPGLLPGYVPCTESTGEWVTGVGVVNTNGRPVDVRLVWLDGNGEPISEQSLHLASREHFAAIIQEMLGADPSAKYVRIEADDAATLAGVYLMASQDGTKLMGGIINFPPNN
jgi:hypothetical protein